MKGTILKARPDLRETKLQNWEEYLYLPRTEIEGEAKIHESQVIGGGKKTVLNDIVMLNTCH